jgi:2',3'-cyclic-nucleotide 2'-phosphodiesterase/3'-nucleotidase
VRRSALATVMLLAAALLPAAGGRSVTIYYSSSLNGNLDGCDCRGNPRAGLVKRAAWLKARRERENSLLVDAGDLLDVFSDPLLSEAILDSYDELDYDAVAVGDQELSNGVESLLRYRESHRLFSHNLTLCPDDTRCVFFSLEPLILSRGSLRVGVFALIDPEVFALYPEELRKALKIASPEQTARRLLASLREAGTELTVLLYHGPYDRARALASRVAGLDIVVVGHEQRLIDPVQVGEATILSPGREGNQLGILTVSVDGRGRKRIDNRFEMFAFATSPDDLAVRRRIETYNEAMRRRLNAQ